MEEGSSREEEIGLPCSPPTPLISRSSIPYYLLIVFYFFYLLMWPNQIPCMHVFFSFFSFHILTYVGPMYLIKSAQTW